MIYEGYQTVELEHQINSDPNLLKFVREVSHTFKLFAYHAQGNDHGFVGVSMCNSEGVHICLLRVGHEINDARETVPLYSYFSNWYSKQRGNGEIDRKTLTSVKLSSLMATLKRNNVIPSREDIIDGIINKGMSDVQSQFRSSVKGTSSCKSNYDIDVESTHTMLKILVGDGSQDLILRLDRTKLKTTLDRWNDIDRLKAERDIAVQEKMLSGGLYAVGATHTKDYMIAKLKVEARVDQYGDKRYSANVESIKRVKTLMDTEFVPLLTMIKVSNEGREMRNTENNDGWCIPYGTQYNESFDVAYWQSYSRHEYIQWSFIPCSAI